MRREHIQKLTSCELICLPFLDTDEPEDVRAANAELRDRSYPAPVIGVLRVICAIGLWHQFLFLWDSYSLDVWDVVQGYSVPMALLGLALALSVSLSIGLGLFVVSVVAFFGAYAGMGRARRRRERDAA